MKILSANLYCNNIEGMPSIGRTTEEQVAVLKACDADVMIAQEQSGQMLERYAREFGPEVATRQQRFFGHPGLNTRQCIAIFSRLPIGREYSQSLGFLHADGVEHVPEFVGRGREVQAVVLAAEIESPEGSFLAVTAHLAWTPKAHDGLMPHQVESLKKLTLFLEDLRENTGLPIILGADFNGLLKDAIPHLPEWLTCLLTDEQIESVGTTIDSIDPERVARMAGFGVFIDGVFASPEVHLLKPVEVITDFSDHKGFLAEVSLR